MDQKMLARWLKVVILGIGICRLAVFLWLVPFVEKSILEGYPELEGWYLPWLIFLEISGLPCFGVLCFGWKIAGNIILWLCGMNHPGVLLATLVVDFIGISVSVAAAGLSHLVEKAAKFQEESELTI